MTDKLIIPLGDDEWKAFENILRSIGLSTGLSDDTARSFYSRNVALNNTVREYLITGGGCFDESKDNI